MNFIMQYEKMKKPKSEFDIHSFIPLLETPHFGMNAEFKQGSQTKQPYETYIFHLNAGEDSISFYTLQKKYRKNQ